MSLKVWLPFLGNSDNIGASDVAITTTNVGFDSNGKLGQCAVATSHVNLNVPRSIYDVYSVTGTEISYSLWFKIDKNYLNQLISTTDFSTKTQIYNKVIGFANGTTSNGVSIHLRTDSGLTQSTVLDQIYIYSWLRNGKVSSGSAVQTINLDEWYHLVISYNASNVLKFYINGSLVDSRTVTRGNLNTSISSQQVRLNTPSCQLSNSDANTKHLFSLIEYFNDVRIYNHALSTAEVHELAQGLVRHYKLDDIVNANLLTGNVNVANTWTLNDATCVADGNALKVTITSDSGNRRIYRGTTNVWTPANSTFTVSFDAKAQTDGLVIDASRSNITTDMTSFTLSTSWKHYKGQIVNTAAVDAGTFSIRCTTNGGIFWIKNVKLERGTVDTGFNYSTYTQTIIADSSGYGKHGTIVGTTTIDSTSPRYSSATHMNAKSTSNHIEAESLPSTTQTISLWLKSTTEGSPVIFADPLSEMCLCLVGSGSYAAVQRATSSKTCYSLSNYSTSNWNHMVITKNGTQYGLWVNGVQASANGSNYWQHNASLLWLFNRSNNNTHASDASISDFRAYVTLLSDGDIKELYRVGLKVDNGDTIHSREFIESDSEHITNNGQIIGHNMMELCPNLHYDKNVYVEPDGSRWVHIAHHNNPNGGVFTSSSLTWGKGVYESADRWYDAEQTVGQATEHEFMVKQATTNTSSQVKYRWIQTVSMLTATYNDVAPSAVTRVTTSGYTDGGFGGIYITNNNARLCIANSKNGNWFGAFGSWTAYQSGIPGYPSTVITTGYIDLYLRIDNFPSLCAKIIKEQGFYGDNLIEM